MNFINTIDLVIKQYHLKIFSLLKHDDLEHLME